MARAFATVAGLAERARRRDLAEAASPNPIVDAGLIAAAIAGTAAAYAAETWPGDAAKQAEATAAAAAALTRLQRDVHDANAEVDGYLGRYAGASAEALSGAVSVYAYDVAVYRVLGGERDSERYERYRSAMKYLSAVAAGKIQLGLDDAGGGAAAPGPRGASFHADESLMTRDALRAF